MTDKKAKGREGTGRDWLIRAAITLFVLGAVAGYAYYDLALRESPEQALASIQALLKAGKYDEFSACLTGRYRKELLGHLVFTAVTGPLITEDMGDTPDPEALALLRKHGIDRKTALKKAATAGVSSLVDQVKDRSVFLADGLKWLGKKSETGTLLVILTKGKMLEATIVGNVAECKVSVSMKPRTENFIFRFEKSATGWLLDDISRTVPKLIRRHHEALRQ